MPVIFPCWSWPSEAKTLGKTAYLYFWMIEYMLKGHPFWYQTIDGNVYYITDTIISVSSLLLQETIVAFVDANSESYAPVPTLINPHIQLVLASSPKGAKQRWLKQNPSGRFVIKYASTLWNPRKFFIMGLVTSWHICGLHWVHFDYFSILLISLMHVSMNQCHILASILVTVLVQAFLPVICFNFRRIYRSRSMISIWQLDYINFHWITQYKWSIPFDIWAVPRGQEASTCYCCCWFLWFHCWNTNCSIPERQVLKYFDTLKSFNASKFVLWTILSSPIGITLAPPSMLPSKDNYLLPLLNLQLGLRSLYAVTQWNGFHRMSID